MIEPSAFAGTSSERDLLERAADWPEQRDLDSLSEESLRQLAAREGIEFATALLFDRVVRSPRHGPFIAAVQSLSAEPAAPLRSLRASGRNGDCPLSSGGPSPFLPDALTVAVVPGAFYQEDRKSGADGEFVLQAVQRLGCRTGRVPLHSFGPLRGNARILRDWLRAHRGGEVVLVSLSKGGAEVKLALAEADAAETFRPVRAWVSLSGLEFGTQLANWLRRRPWRLLPIRVLFWLRGYHFPALAELERSRGGLLDFELRPPEGLRVLHVVGFPLARHLTSALAERGYRRMAPLGPNDGGPILLADVLRLPGLVYPVWGADHYLRPAWDVRGLVARLLQAVCGERETINPVARTHWNR
jgi:hypothetical protein